MLGVSMIDQKTESTKLATVGQRQFGEKIQTDF